ncbi:hypothetical protein [uncultured Clostridium sp.]|uniref:hypothetical protein n=1 Tax=Clostridium TaxID=1485 RepID=UPI0025EF3061|nr:hypothetical protein [uncultured Clostridium sp.]MDU2289367.1 hypothetical protein [Clostridium celatum]
MKSTVRVTKWVAGGLEALLGIPVLGASIIIGLVWTPLAIMLVFHIVNLVLSKNEDLPVAGSILGIVGNAIGWIPFVGMIMHILTAIFVMVEAYKTKVE